VKKDTMHTTVATVLQCAVFAGIETTPEQEAAFVKQLETALGGAAVYFPKRAARPCGQMAIEPGYTVQKVQEQYGVCRATAYSWLRRSKK